MEANLHFAFSTLFHENLLVILHVERDRQTNGSHSRHSFVDICLDIIHGCSTKILDIDSVIVVVIVVRSSMLII